jgi:hypothetical protein
VLTLRPDGHHVEVSGEGVLEADQRDGDVGDRAGDARDRQGTG